MKQFIFKYRFSFLIDSVCLQDGTVTVPLPATKNMTVAVNITCDYISSCHAKFALQEFIDGVESLTVRRLTTGTENVLFIQQKTMTWQDVRKCYKSHN